MLSQALSVFDFLKIKYPNNSQRIVLYAMPILVGLASIVLSIYLHNKDINLFIHDRFGDIFAFLAVLPGFYIASLAAVSAINKIAIDEIINKDSNPPYLIKREPNRPETYQQPLTRRLFLSMLFAYLATVSLFLTLTLIGIRFYFAVFLNAMPTIIVLAICYFLVFFLLTQILLLTLVGISYLGYKSLANN